MMLNDLEKQLGKGRVQEHKDISLYFTLRTKTTAQYFFTIESFADLQNVVKAVHVLNIPLLFLGGGSNIAVTKEEIKGLVVRNLYQEKEILAETPETVDILFSSGYPMSRVVNETANAGYEGFEYHLGLPGTLGGALYMNSKWTKPMSYVGDHLLYAYLIDKEGNMQKKERDYFQFAYDYSILQKTHEIVAGAAFRLKKTDSELLKKRAQEALAYRHKTQPFGVATCGCFFQNVNKGVSKDPETSAGYLIDQAGLKGTQIGEFVVSDKHANFIVNKGNGNPEDLFKLMELVKSKVQEKFGVQLKEEVIII